jgi:hypothetical protein
LNQSWLPAKFQRPWAGHKGKSGKKQ